MQEHFGAKDPGVTILSFGPQILSLGPPKMGKARGVKILSLEQKTPE
jgi:hypothetical protein